MIGIIIFDEERSCYFKYSMIRKLITKLMPSLKQVDLKIPALDRRWEFSRCTREKGFLTMLKFFNRLPTKYKI